MVATGTKTEEASGKAVEGRERRSMLLASFNRCLVSSLVIHSTFFQAERVKIDLEEARFQADKRKEAIERAKTLLYYQTDRVKQFHVS